MAILPPEDYLLSNWILRYPISNTTPYGLIYWISKCKQGKAPYWLAQNGQATNRNMESCFGSIHGGLTNKQGGLTLAYSVGASTYQFHSQHVCSVLFCKRQPISGAHRYFRSMLGDLELCRKWRAWDISEDP